MKMSLVENLIKREKSSPSRVKKETKSSSEILSELFGVFNAPPPEIRETPERKSKRVKKDKKHKKDKKRSRRDSSSSDDSERRHRRRKKKSKRHRSSSHSRTPPLRSRSRTPARKPKIEAEIKPEKLKSEPKDKTLDTKIKKERVKEEQENGETKAKIRRISTKDDDKNFQVIFKNEDASKIPMPDSPRLSSNDLRLTLDSKHAEVENERSKSSKIQIKNLKFSAVFEETVKKAEEEARKKAEACEEGEYTDSSSGSPEPHAPSPDNPQFPKSNDPGGILKKSDDKKREDRSRERSRSDKKKHSDSSHKSSRKRSRDNSKSRRRSKSRSRHRSRSKDRKKSSRRSRSRSFTRTFSRRHNNLKLGPRRSKSPGVRLGDTEKRRLLEVARRNAINMLKNGAVPAAAAALPPHTRHQVMAAIQSGGKSVDELTDFCKHLSKKEALGELSSVSSNDSASDNEDTLAFHHPFLVKEKAPIVMNIRGGAPLPVKSGPLALNNKEELRLQFPVSSGTQHRGGEREWRAVTPPPADSQIVKLNHKHPPKHTSSGSSAIASTSDTMLALPPPPGQPSELPPGMKTLVGGTPLPSVSTLPVPGPQAYPPGIEPATPKMDLDSIVSQKLLAIRKQSEKELIPAASGVLSRAVHTTLGFRSGSRLGAFTGSTGVQILTPRELASGSQAWAKKDQLVRAAPVEGGMGMHLLQKMGWTPGKGLGKEETGTLQPLLLEVKLDTRGLQAKEEKKPQRGGVRRSTAASVSAAVVGVSGKHPVSLLGEYCSKRKLGPPEYELCFECGPDHKKNFLVKVKVAGIEYQPAVASANKKQAKADSAQIALQKLGVLP